MVVLVRPTAIMLMPITLGNMIQTDCFDEICDEAVGLLMTYRCNLNCKYCYIHTKHNKDMSLRMAQSILEPFLQKEGGRIDITFMGGETLLAMDVIIPLVEWVENGHWKREYRLFGSTNGTLLSLELKKWLTKHRHSLTLGLSYDGLPSIQKYNRGENGIDIDFFLKTWPKQPIQMTINAASVSQMARGVIYLLEKGAQVHPNVAFERQEWTDEQVTEYGRQLFRLALYYNNHQWLPPIIQFIHNLSEYAGNIGGKKPQLEVCGAGNGFQVFDTDGQSYPCHILSPLVLEGESLQIIKDGLVAKTNSFADPECESCPYSVSCPTCIACNYLYRGCLQKRDKTHCKIMKTEVKAYIKKEVLRLKTKDVLTPHDATEIDAIKKLVDYEKRSRVY